MVSTCSPFFVAGLLCYAVTGALQMHLHRGIGTTTSKSSTIRLIFVKKP